MKATDIETDSLLPRLKLTVRLLHNGEIAMGPGKAELLEAIKTSGSIAAAGKTMNMSYRRAWLLVDVMNRSFAEPLVQTAKGGKHGGGTILTPLGQQVLEHYNKMSEAVNHSAQAYLPLFSGLMAKTEKVEIEQSQEGLAKLNEPS
jgi:molybdate transport system regulatory protein